MVYHSGRVEVNWANNGLLLLGYSLTQNCGLQMCPAMLGEDRIDCESEFAQYFKNVGGSVGW
uniref:Uncharacterized protein n=1 Tax=Anguilla anguilla TaxID=7936 RepID=A0A0E9TZI0_ANGAN